MNGKLEEMKNASMKMIEELNEKIEEGKKNEKEMEKLREKSVILLFLPCEILFDTFILLKIIFIESFQRIGEMKRRMGEESQKFRALEQMNEDLAKKNTVADEALIETTTHYEVYCNRIALLINILFRI